jgi:hypothetical protein
MVVEVMIRVLYSFIISNMGFAADYSALFYRFQLLLLIILNRYYIKWPREAEGKGARVSAEHASIPVSRNKYHCSYQNQPYSSG